MTPHKNLLTRGGDWVLLASIEVLSYTRHGPVSPNFGLEAGGCKCSLRYKCCLIMTYHRGLAIFIVYVF